MVLVTPDPAPHQTNATNVWFRLQILKEHHAKQADRVYNSKY